MTKRILLSAAMIVAASSFAFAQKTISKTNALWGAAFKTVVTTQEVKIAKNITTSTSVKVRPASEINMFGLGAVDVDNGPDYTPFGKTKFSGVGNVTELRFYGKKKGAFHGFYFGTYFSYMHYTLSSAYIREDFHDQAGNLYQADVSQVFKINIGQGGVEIGTMGLYANNHLCIDWTIIGVGFGTIGLQGGLEATNVSASDFDWRNYQTDLYNTNTGVDHLFKKLKDRRDITPTDATIGVKVPMVFLRSGLSLGFGYGANWKIGGKKDKTGSGDGTPTQPTVPSGNGTGQWR